MAIGAGLHATCCGNDVSAGERPSSGAVVKLAIGPGNRVVASRAHGGREVCRHVVGHCAAKCRGAVPVSRMAVGAPAITGS